MYDEFIHALQLNKSPTMFDEFTHALQLNKSPTMYDEFIHALQLRQKPNNVWWISKPFLFARASEGK